MIRYTVKGKYLFIFIQNKSVGFRVQAIKAIPNKTDFDHLAYLSMWTNRYSKGHAMLHGHLLLWDMFMDENITTVL